VQYAFQSHIKTWARLFVVLSFRIVVIVRYTRCSSLYLRIVCGFFAPLLVIYTYVNLIQMKITVYVRSNFSGTKRSYTRHLCIQRYLLSMFIHMSKMRVSSFLLGTVRKVITLARSITIKNSEKLRRSMQLICTLEKIKLYLWTVFITFFVYLYTLRTQL